jgi:hypothetical protein
MILPAGFSGQGVLAAGARHSEENPLTQDTGWNLIACRWAARTSVQSSPVFFRPSASLAAHPNGICRNVAEKPPQIGWRIPPLHAAMDASKPTDRNQVPFWYPLAARHPAKALPVVG